MDPDANLREQLELAQQMIDHGIIGVDTIRLAELVLALDEWIKKGGFLPQRWTKK